MAVIRGLEDADHPALLQINAANVPAVARLDARELRRLADIGDLHQVAVDGDQTIVGYLLAFASSDAYDGEEFRHYTTTLRQPFIYVDQIAIAASGQRRGAGRTLYLHLINEAGRRSVRLVCCEVNARPPNPGSLKFHKRMGFRAVGSMDTADGRIVALLTRPA